jgi:hypothetical protein
VPTLAADAERTYFRVRTHVSAPSCAQDTLGAPTEAAGRGASDPGLLSRLLGGDRAAPRQPRRRTPPPPPEDVIETAPKALEAVTVMVTEAEPEGPGPDAVDSYRSASGLTMLE